MASPDTTNERTARVAGQGTQRSRSPRAAAGHHFLASQLNAMISSLTLRPLLAMSRLTGFGPIRGGHGREISPVER